MKKTSSDSKISEQKLPTPKSDDATPKKILSKPQNQPPGDTESRSFAPKQIVTRLPKVEHRRHKRYLVKWRIAIVYEGGNGKKTFHGRVNEISMGGLSIHCDHNVFHDGKVILLLALPPLFAGGREKILEITCRMNYTILSKTLFRIGLEFVEFRSGDKKLLEERLEISNAGGIAYSEA
ncbi:PilZ domain-containing protein [Undibacterium flavidum]|uniref:PilZ domain-containing protein n=1 Tax=Undibacterium flavidum TaxID=2762297 RepID=A0ABR6YH56_9BURK|nr:PilZ domain-containing protein [Undibacterium flavidum]MBC3875896.1 PilZ domain-containing protein [Undibacterium flavidum]